ncbi:MAG: hypothetical protein LLF76_02990 [Planctomycetaceae bacterium]|nr:hypothetical protein [Planctomycetaceae bacterium]
MSTISTIAIKITGNADSLNRATSQADGYLKRLHTSVNRLAGILTTMGVAAAGVAVYGMARMVKSQMEAIDATAKLADRVGMSTESLSAYQHAAQLAGLSSEEFNKGIEIFVRRLGEVVQGSGEAKTGMEMLDLSINDLINKKPDEAFKLIAERIKLLDTQSQKAAAAYYLFGRSGSKMLNLMEEDLDGVIAEAERLGIAFSRVDASKVEAANDAMERTRASAIGVANSISIGLAPALEVIADRATDLTSGYNSMETIKKHVQGAAIAATYLVDAFQVVRAVVNGIIGSVQRLMAVSTAIPAEIVAKFGNLAEKLHMEETADLAKQISADIDAIGKEMYDAGGKNLEQAAEQIQSVGKLRQEMTEFFNEVDQRQVEIQEQSKNTVPIDFEALEQQKSHLEELGRFAESVYNKTRTPLEKYREEVEKLDEALKANLITLDTYNRGVKAAAEDMENASKKADKLSREGLRVGDTFASAFGDAIIEGEKLSNVLQALAEDLMRIFANRLILAPIANGIDDMIAGGGSGAFFSGLFGKAGGAGTAAASATPSLNSAAAMGEQWMAAPVMHGGGIAGILGLSRFVPASAFLNAPRYHKGFMPDEVPAVLRRDEGVFTPEQMAALGRGGDNFNMNVTVQAIDTQSGMQFVGKMARPIANQMYSQMRRNHRIRRGG